MQQSNMSLPPAPQLSPSGILYVQYGHGDCEEPVRLAETANKTGKVLIAVVDVREFKDTIPPWLKGVPQMVVFDEKGTSSMIYSKAEILTRLFSLTSGDCFPYETYNKGKTCSGRMGFASSAF